MHSFFVVLMSVPLGIGIGRMVPTPVVTPAPSMSEIELARRQEPDAISLAEILLTAVPESLRRIAATNIPAASSILWEEFLDDKKPPWFSELPWEIQVYLIERFGPATAVVPPSPTGPVNPSQTVDVPSHPVETDPSQPASTVQSPPVQTGPIQTTGSVQSQSQDGSSGPARSTHGPVDSETTVAASPSMTLATTSTASSAAGTSTSGASGAESAPTAASTAPTSTSIPDAPPAPLADDEDRSRAQKIGIGLGVPLGILGAAALLFGCCTLLRRHRRKKVDGSIPPSSPGFIPRFAFQEEPVRQEPDERLLNPNSSTSFSDLHNMTWDDEPIHDTSSSGESMPTLNNNIVPANNPYQIPQPPTQPVVAPALLHTHSSNRARGRRTSYTSLHSVTEVSEPDEGGTYVESPILPREGLPRHPQAVKRHFPPHGLIPTPPVPGGSQIKRKPLRTGSVVETTPPNNPAAHAASQPLLHQTMMAERNRPHRPHLATQMAQQQHRRRSSSSSASPYVSPFEEYSPRNPFLGDEEDYRSEYAHQRFAAPNSIPNPQISHTQASHIDDFIDISDGLYGGDTSLSRYPSLKASSPRTDCPLRRNWAGGGHRRNKSPIWDQI